MARERTGGIVSRGGVLFARVTYVDSTGKRWFSLSLSAKKAKKAKEIESEGLSAQPPCEKSEISPEGCDLISLNSLISQSAKVQTGDLPLGQGAETPSGVSFMITREIRRQLYELNYTDAEIDRLRPAEAHHVLGYTATDNPNVTPPGWTPPF